MPKSAQEALVTGAWDATGMLLDEYQEVQAVAARLPYVRGFLAGASDPQRHSQRSPSGDLLFVRARDFQERLAGV